MRTLHLDLGRELRGGQYQALALVEALGSDALLLARAGSPLYHAALARSMHVEAANLRTLRKHLSEVDLVHAHDANAHQWLALLSSKPLVVSRRVAFPVKRGPVSRWKYSRAARYLAVSEFVAARLEAAGVPRSKISVVCDGVDLPEQLSRGGGIVAIRSADPAKGSGLLEQAAAIGGFQVRWAESLVDDLQRADVFVYISYAEGLGSAALHAMAAGVPVVASRVGGLPEIVKSGETGLLVDNEPHRIAEAIHKVCANRADLGKRARVFVESQFTKQHMLERTVEAYRTVLS
ncbi:MAG TPA: glycosyltransferase family 4 protein [Bryobacteraceae bacterium]|nr:glycosyltransferase family 4 protein [Bryobacteraceae bacterium]